MTQTVTVRGQENEHRFLGAESSTAVPTSGDTTIAQIDVNGKTLLCFHFAVATNNLDNFDVTARPHPDAAQHDFTPADWTSLPSGGRFRRASGNLAAVAAAGTGYFEMDVSGLDQVVVKASATGGAAAVTSYWSLT